MIDTKTIERNLAQLSATRQRFCGCGHRGYAHNHNTGKCMLCQCKGVHENQEHAMNTKTNVLEGSGTYDK